MSWAHEWDVVGDAGRIRFVPCDEAGVPADRTRYEAFRAAEARGELVYRGVIQRPVDHATTAEPDEAADRSYRQDVVDAARIADVSPGGTLGLYRDL
jgi:hypothetical protein